MCTFTHVYRYLYVQMYSFIHRMKPIKIVKVYAEDHPKLNSLRRELTREVGEQGSYADVIRCLVELRIERNSPLLCKYRTLEEQRAAE